MWGIGAISNSCPFWYHPLPPFKWYSAMLYTVQNMLTSGQCILYLEIIVFFWQSCCFQYIITTHSFQTVALGPRAQDKHGAPATKICTWPRTSNHGARWTCTCRSNFNLFHPLERGQAFHQPSDLINLLKFYWKFRKKLYDMDFTRLRILWYMGFLTAKVCPSAWLKKEATSSQGASQVASYMNHHESTSSNWVI